MRMNNETFLFLSNVNPKPVISHQTSTGQTTSGQSSAFDPACMEADLCHVELEVAPSVLVLYGSLLRNLLHLKVSHLLYFIYIYKVNKIVANIFPKDDIDFSGFEPIAFCF